VVEVVVEVPHHVVEVAEVHRPDEDHLADDLHHQEDEDLHHSAEDQEDQCPQKDALGHREDVVDRHLVDDRDHQCEDDRDHQLDVGHHHHVITEEDPDHQLNEDLEQDHQHLNQKEFQLQNLPEILQKNIF